MQVAAAIGGQQYAGGGIDVVGADRGVRLDWNRESFAVVSEALLVFDTCQFANTISIQRQQIVRFIVLIVVTNTV